MDATGGESVYYVYMLRCRGDVYYTGITPDVARRMRAHAGGRGAKFTRSHPPQALCALWRCRDRAAASRVEYAIKARLSHGQKAQLTASPERLLSLLPQLGEIACTPVYGLTLEDCLAGAGEA